jgi:hypothetical protein
MGLLLEMVVSLLGYVEEERELYFELTPAQCSQQARPGRCALTYTAGYISKKGSAQNFENQERASHTAMIHHSLTKDAI